MILRRLSLTTTLLSTTLLIAPAAFGQTSVEDERTTTVRTSAGGDVTITGSGSIIITDEDTPALVVDSDNDANNAGFIAINNIDDTTAVILEGGNTGDFINSGNIALNEDFDQESTDDDNIPDTRFAQGTGRTGILISGASPFQGNVELASSGAISVEGNNSYGIRLMETAGLIGDLTNSGIISLTGDFNRAVSVEGDVIGNLAIGGTLSTSGEGSSGVVVEGDVDGAVTLNGSITNSGYRFTTRPNAFQRTLLDEDDLYQAGSAVVVNGNVTRGINFGTVVAVDDDGNETITGRASLSQLSGASAVLIDGNGTPISIGIVAEITNPDDDNFDTDLQYAFVNQGTLTANGLYDDFNATVLEIRDAILDGGINNTMTMRSTTFRGGDDGVADVDGNIGLARVIVLGDGAIADSINNSGMMLAAVSEASDEIYSDPDNIIPPRLLTAVAIDIEAGADVTSLNNSGTIQAVIGGRSGTVYGIRDASGTLSNITNTGLIVTQAINSDVNGEEPTDFLQIAIDASNNITGVTIIQEAPVDLDPDDDITPANPAITGNILLGSGDDSIDVRAGVVAGDIAFGDGADTLTISGSSAVSGEITDSDGNLIIDVSDNSTLLSTGSSQIDITSASFDGTSTFRPFIDEEAGQVSTLAASGTVTFEDGATVNPVLDNVINGDSATFTIASGSSVVVGGDVNALSGEESPYLYNTTYTSSANNLAVTFDRRTAAELGLDNPQASIYESAYEALQNSNALGGAIVRLTNQTDFNAAYNQLLPEFAAAGRQYVLANVDGATGAVGSHLDNARRSQERSGGAWIEEFAYFADRSLAGLSEQYRGSGFGVTGGFDTEWGPFHTVGINFGFASTEIEDVLGQDDPMNVTTLQAGLYGGIEMGKFGLDLYAGGGYNDYETNRSVNIGAFSETAQGDWSGTHFNGSAKLGYDVEFGKYFLRPNVSATYLSLKESEYTEEGSIDIAQQIFSRSAETGSVTAALDFGGDFKGKRTWMRPSVRLGVRQELFDDTVFTIGRFLSGTELFELESQPFPDTGYIMGLTFAAGTRYSSISFDYDADIRDGFNRHTARLVVRMLF